MPELADLLTTIASQAAAVREHENALSAERLKLHELLREAHAAGVSFELLGKISGRSRQSVAKSLKRAESK